MIIVYHHTSLPYHKWCNEWTTKTMRRGGQRRTTRAREEPIIGTSLPWCWVIILLVEVGTQRKNSRFCGVLRKKGRPLITCWRGAHSYSKCPFNDDSSNQTCFPILCVTVRHLETASRSCRHFISFLNQAVSLFQQDIQSYIQYDLVDIQFLFSTKPMNLSQ